MSTLVLDSLEIKNFRAFKHLRIEKLGRVNLIVGKNNVGKTSVLEALRLYASKGDAYDIFSLLKNRNELSRSDSDTDFRLEIIDFSELLTSLRYLFHGREDVKALHNGIVISTIKNILTPESSIVIDVAFPYDDFKPGNNTQFAPQLQVVVNDEFTFSTKLHQSHFYKRTQQRKSLKEVPHIYIAAYGLNLRTAENYWDQISLSSLEDDVLAALRLISPQIERINFIGGSSSSEIRFPMTKVSGIDKPFPLASLGEGMNRMLGIALALVNAKDGMLLIDEVDTGLHYSVLPEMWNLIFEVAHRLNVQVFATSHSWDCIQAFQQAADANTDEEGMLIRLEQRKDGIRAVTFDEEELSVVAREQIEVR